jgi:Fe-S cluster assembly protein SufD
MSAVARRESQLERSTRIWVNDELSLSEPPWLSQRRQLAREYFDRNGIPTNRQESFRFLPLSSIASESLRPAVRSDSTTQFNGSALPTAASIGFIDGQPQGSLRALPPGLRIDRLEDLLRSAPDALEPYFSKLAAPIHSFAAIGLAAFRDAWIIRVAAGASIELPVDIVVQQKRGGYWAIPRLLIVLEANSQLKVIERHVPSESPDFGLTTGVFEILLEQGACLHHVRLCGRGGSEAELSATSVQVESNAHYHAWTATNGGMLTRFDTHVRLVGRDARADLDGLYVARGKDIVDHHTVVVHECESTTVEESYKGIVDDEAQAVFDGLIVVKPGAIHTNAQQFNRNLLLSDSAVVHTKPQLEIDADDVTCGHGATVGKLDEQQIFYLQSRGVSSEYARQMLTRAFAAELIDRCPISEAMPHLTGDLHSLFASTEQGVW